MMTDMLKQRMKELQAGRMENPLFRQEKLKQETQSEGKT